MIYGLSDLKAKEVINIENGEKLGFIDDMEFESESGMIAAFIIMGRSRLWGLLGRDDDIILSVKDIELIGKDTILVRHSEETAGRNKRKNFIIENLFEKNKKNA